MSFLLNAQLERHRYRGLKTATATRFDVTWGEAKSVEVQAGAVLSIVNAGGSSVAWLTALSGDERDFSARSLDVPYDLEVPIDPTAFDSRSMADIAGARESNLADGTVFRVFERLATTILLACPGITYIIYT